MTEESERRKSKGEEVGEVTDEESVELWLVEEKKKGEEYMQWQQRGNSSRMPPSSGGGMAGYECVCGLGGWGGWGGTQFVNAITVDLPSLTTESNQHCGGNSSA